MKILDHLASLVWLVAIAAVVLALLSPAADGQSELRMSRADAKREAVVNARGDLHVPSNYRAAYEFLGTWAIAAAKGVGSSELHNVYATPGTIAAFHTSGHSPDETPTSPMTTGTVTHAQILKGWFLDAFAGRGK